MSYDSEQNQTESRASSSAAPKTTEGVDLEGDNHSKRTFFLRPRPTSGSVQSYNQGATNRPSVAGLFPRRRGSEEVLAKTLRVIPHQLFHALRIWRSQDQPNVVLLVIHPPDDFRIAIGRGIRMFLPCQRNQQTSGIVSGSRRLVRRFATCNFDLRPLSPKIDASRGFDEVGNMRSSHARRGFKEVQLAIVAAADELAVRDAAHQSERFQHLFVERNQWTLFVRSARQSARSEDITLMRDVHRRASITAGD